MRKLTIVMTYHHRQQQLFLTLRSLQAQYDKDIDIIIMDDGSDTERYMAKPISDQFSEMNIQAIHLPRDKRWWINPSVPYNMGFKLAKGEIIVITNPECFHIGETIQYIRDNIKYDNYLTFSAYATTSRNHSELGQVVQSTQGALPMEVEAIIKPMQIRQWYNHPIHRPTGYHFLSAITKQNLDRIGGFNEKFATGYCFDDDEFLWRIRESGLKIQMVDPSYGYVIHQWHEKNSGLRGGCEEWEKNRQIWISITGGKRLDGRPKEARN